MLFSARHWAVCLETALKHVKATQYHFATTLYPQICFHRAVTSNLLWTCHFKKCCEIYPEQHILGFSQSHVFPMGCNL